MESTKLGNRNNVTRLLMESTKLERGNGVTVIQPALVSLLGNQIQKFAADIIIRKYKYFLMQSTHLLDFRFINGNSCKESFFLTQLQLHLSFKAVQNSTLNTKIVFLLCGSSISSLCKLYLFAVLTVFLHCADAPVQCEAAFWG